MYVRYLLTKHIITCIINTYFLLLLQFLMSVSCYLHLILRHVVTLKDSNNLKRDGML